MKAFLIARVSTEDQKDALPAQIHNLNDYAERQHFSETELIEIQESAYKGSRESFLEVIKKIRLCSVTVAVVLDKVDRLTRDSGDEATRALINLCRAGKIELHFPSDNLVVHKDSPATDVMRLGLNAVLAQYYSDSISNNVKRRLQQKLRDGEWIGKASFGYKNVDKSDGTKDIVIDHDEALIVKSIFEWYSTGTLSFRLIKQKLRSVYDINYSSSNVEFILKNPFYIGQMRSKGVLYPHKYKRIISESLFQKAKSVREGYGVMPAKFAGLPYAYRGLITCAECGCLVTFEKKKAKYVYGHCTQSKGKHGAVYIPEDKITEQLASIFDSVAIPEEVYAQMSDALKKSDDESVLTQKADIARIDADINRNQNRLERVYDDYLDDRISEEFYNKKYAEITERVKELKNTRKIFELVEKDTFNSVSYLLELSMKAPELFKIGDFEQKRTLIKNIYSNLEFAGEKLRWELKKPFNTMALCNVSGNWLRLLGSNQRHPR